MKLLAAIGAFVAGLIVQPGGGAIDTPSLPSSSEIDLQLQTTGTSGRVPFPVVAWAGTPAGTTATGMGGATVEKGLSWWWSYGDTAGRYQTGTTYRSGAPANTSYGWPVGGHLYTETGSFTLRVDAEKPNAEAEATTATVSATGWLAADTHCILPTAPVPNNEASWNAAGCPSGVFTAGRTSVGTNLNTLIDAISKSDGTQVAILAGTYTSAGNIANPNGVDWRVTGSLAAARPTVNHTGCTSALFAGRNGAGYFRLDAIDYDGNGGSGEGCAGGFGQRLVDDSDPTQGIVLYDIDMTDNGTILGLSYQGTSFTNYPDNFNQRIAVADVTLEEIETNVDSTPAMLFRLDAYGVLLVDFHTVHSTHNAEFHLRTHAQDKWFVGGYLMEGVRNDKTQVTVRGCNQATQCGGGGGSGNSFSNSSGGLWGQDYVFFGGIHDLAGNSDRPPLGLANVTNDDNGCEQHRRGASVSTHFRNSGSEIANNIAFMLSIYARSHTMAVINNTFDTQNIGLGPEIIDVAADNGSFCDTPQSPQDITVIGTSVYDTGSETPQAVIKFQNATANSRQANMLVYAPNWSSVLFCAAFLTTPCSVAEGDEWADEPSQGNVDAATCPFVGNDGSCTMPAASLHEHFKLQAGRTDGISLPPGSETEWRKYDQEMNAFSQQPGAWANQ